MKPINPHNQPGIYKRLKPAERVKADELAKYLYNPALEGLGKLKLTDYEFKHDLINIAKWISFTVKFLMLIPIGNATLRAGVSTGAEVVNEWCKDYLKMARV